jgi:hypothetical protein
LNIPAIPPESDDWMAAKKDDLAAVNKRIDEFWKTVNSKANPIAIPKPKSRSRNFYELLMRRLTLRLLRKLNKD